MYNLDLESLQEELWANAHRDGYVHMQIKDLNGGIGQTENKNGSGAYSFNVDIMDEQNQCAYEDGYIKINLSMPDPLDILNDKTEEEIADLYKQMKMLPIDLMFNNAEDFLDAYYKMGWILKPIHSLITGKGQSILSTLGEVSYDQWFDLDALVSASLQFSLLGAGNTIECQCLYKQIEQEIKEKKKEYQINNFGQYTCMTVRYMENGQDMSSEMQWQYIGCQLVSAKAAYRICMLKKYGLEYYLNEVISEEMVPEDRTKKKYVDDIIRRITKDYSFLEDGLEEALSERPVETIRIIEDGITQLNEDILGLSDWLK